MAASTQTSELNEAFAQYKPENFAEIIGKLAGDKANLKIDIQELKLCIRKTRFEINGQISFNVIHKKPLIQTSAER